MPTPAITPFSATSEDRTAAILSYITIIGFIVAIVLHANKKTALGSFHLRQMLGLIVLAFAAGIAVTLSAFILGYIPVIGPLFISLIWVGVWVAGVIFWMTGLVAAIQGKTTPVPVIGAPIQKWFANTFN